MLGRVGKTSLTTKYCLGQFNENEESTINASYLQKDIEIEGQKKTLAIWVYLGYYQSPIIIKGYSWTGEIRCYGTNLL